MPERAGRLGVSVIGAGRVGPVLAAALAGAGHAIVGISASSPAATERVQAMLPGVPLLPVPELVERAELIILAVPDDQLPGLVDGLASLGAWQPGQLVAHTSASFGVDVLSPAIAAGAIPLALHPLIEFTGSSLDLQRLSGSYIAVAAPTAVLPIAQALAVELGGEPLVVREDQREQFAEAVATARSFSTAIVEQVTRSLSEIGVLNPGRVIGPLVRSSVDNALAKTAGSDPGLEGLSYVESAESDEQ